MRALVIAHGHPDFGPGGGEIAARNLFLGLGAHPGIAAGFLARTASDTGEEGPGITRLRAGEYLWRRDMADGFLLSGSGETDVFSAFLRAFSPDVVFVHHFVHLGIEILSVIRDVLPSVRLVLTLHDYIAICQNGGLMVKTGFDGALCEAASPASCHACFPEVSPGDFVARQSRLLDHFGTVDRFVAPSHFLKARFVDWGLASERIAVVRNGLEPMAHAPWVAPDIRLALGVFGQLRPEKGLDLLLGALHRLSEPERSTIRLDVNGSRLEAQPGWYRTLVERLVAPLIENGTVRWRGFYRREALPARMAGLDFVVVPSRWWENAPLVIDEAFAFRTPVLGARLGGIAEAVSDGLDGLLFEPRSMDALSGLLRDLVHDPARRIALSLAIRPPQTLAGMAAEYLGVAGFDSIRTVPDSSAD